MYIPQIETNIKGYYPTNEELRNISNFIALKEGPHKSRIVPQEQRTPATPTFFIDTLKQELIEYRRQHGEG